MGTRNTEIPEEFTLAALGRLQGRAGGVPYEVRDPTHKGLLLRVEPSGRKSWYFVYQRPNGARGRLRLGAFPTLKVEGARRAATVALGDVAKGNDPAGDRRARRQQEREARKSKVAEAERQRLLTLKTYLDERYKPWAEVHQRSAAANLQRLRAAFDDLMAKPMDKIIGFTLDAWRARRKKDGVTKDTIQRDLTQLRSLFNHALTAGVIQTHPLLRMKQLKRKEQSNRVRFLSPAEEASLRKALAARDAAARAARIRFNAWRSARSLETLPVIGADDYSDFLTPLILTAMNSGMRRGELFALRWRAVDLQRKTLVVEAASAKSGESRFIPLNTELAAVLERWLAQAGAPKANDFVFPGANGGKLTNCQTSWDNVRTAAGLVDFRLHDLRHTFASWLVQEGVGLDRVQKLMGHSTMEMTLRYSHLRDADLRDAVEKLAAA